MEEEEEEISVMIRGWRRWTRGARTGKEEGEKGTRRGRGAILDVGGESNDDVVGGGGARSL